MSYSSELSGQHCASDTAFYEPNNIPFYAQLYPQQATECTQFFNILFFCGLLQRKYIFWEFSVEVKILTAGNDESLNSSSYQMHIFNAGLFVHANEI